MLNGGQKLSVLPANFGKQFHSGIEVNIHHYLINIPTLISLIAEEVGINVEGGIFWKKLVHNCNKPGVEGGKNLRNQ